MYNLHLNQNYTNGLKVFAAFLVMMGHYASYALSHKWSDSLVWNIIASQSGFTGVAIFFFLSGYGLMESEKKNHLSLPDFVRRRFLKIYKPVLFVTALWIIFELLFLAKPLDNSIVYSLLWGFDDCVLWFVKILFGLYLTFYLYSECRNYGYKTAGILFLGLGSLVLMYIAHMTDGYSPIAIPCFLLGVLTSSNQNYKMIFFLIGVLFFVSTLFSVFTTDNHGYHAAFNYALVACIIIASGKGIKIANSRTTAVLSYLSLLSFDVYLIHLKLLDSVVKLGGGINVPIFIVLCIIISAITNIVRNLLKI